MADYTLDIDFARRWVAEQGENPSPIEDNWCWSDLGKAYPHLLPAAMAFFEAARDGEEKGTSQ